MHAVLEFQRAFLRTVIDGAPALPLAQSHVPLHASWEIYRRNYVENHLAALADTYTGVHDLVGAAYFRQLARLYVQTHASASADLNRYGLDFPEFLERELAHLPSGSGLPYLADMASLDSARVELLFSSPGSAAWIAQLSSMPQESWGQLRVDAAAICLRSAFPIDSIWRMQQGESVDLDLAQAQSVLLSYQDGVQMQVLSQIEAVFLSHWFGGMSLEQALEQALVSAMDAGGFDLLGLLTQLAQCNAIRQLISNEECTKT